MKSVHGLRLMAFLTYSRFFSILQRHHLYSYLIIDSLISVHFNMAPIYAHGKDYQINEIVLEVSKQPLLLSICSISPVLVLCLALFARSRSLFCQVKTRRNRPALNSQANHTDSCLSVRVTRCNKKWICQMGREFTYRGREKKITAHIFHLFWFDGKWSPLLMVRCNTLRSIHSTV